MTQPLLMHINNTVFLRDGNLVIIDRRCFPHRIEELICRDYEEVARGIEVMAVQGAGDIAITAAYGLYMAARDLEPQFTDPEKLRISLSTVKERLFNTRPTGYHLGALLNKIWSRIVWERGGIAQQIMSFIAEAIDRQQKRSELTGRWAEQVLEDGDKVLTHCFPGSALLYMLYFAAEKGKKLSVIATETRPYLQGARLTAWSVSQLGIPVTLISDNMAAYCMSANMISKVFTAADRIALDGTVANKVGTYQLAIAASYHHIPLYILGYGGPDRNCRHGRDIPIEYRDPEEVTSFAGSRITGKSVVGFYPAFDLTPSHLITGVITDRGIFGPEQVGDYWVRKPAEL
ncbi:MAG: s-methyl-5-thioribose-1-phosphate isomerase [Syntrophomonadaceae bacterium]|nr:s-methyl-5-thioribose-1-phosphate isomerase [Syntrophomonadaceae bacterium]